MLRAKNEHESRACIPGQVSTLQDAGALVARRPEVFARRVVSWQASHGRSQLPWQGTRDPYRVWLSEIMLQQTQVSTVLGYYERFIERYPDVAALAAASQDDVLSLWSGLGYYSRARNLHRCAQAVMNNHGGEFPKNAQALQALPGIGRSTAAAIAAFCFGERATILDGNVKRVLTRVLGFDGDLALASSERWLWQQAEALLPKDTADMPGYTQGLMDLGATVCLPRKPGCLICPMHEICVACKDGDPQRLPVKTRKQRRSAQSLWVLQALQKNGSVWLEKRPDRGVWAGLYCLPMFDSMQALESAVPAQPRLEPGEPFVHVLTHKDLHIHPVRVLVPASAMKARSGAWFTTAQWPSVGLPAPIRRLLGFEPSLSRPSPAPAHGAA